MNLGALILLFAATWMSAPAQYTPAKEEWNRPIGPFRIVGSVYYVGASDVSAFLIATSEGLILLDTGFAGTAPGVEVAIRQLGFRPGNVRILLASHAHYDHAGGLAYFKRLSGARFLANPVEAELFAHGGKGDFAFGDSYLFPPVKPDSVLRDRDRIRLGDTIVTAHFTSGHTKGCTSYSTVVRDGDRSYNVVFPCSLSAPGYQLLNNPKYPGIAKDFEKTFATLRSLPCDVFLGGHSWDFDLTAKRKARQMSPAANPFVDPQGYRAWLARSEAAFRRQLAEVR